MVTISAEDFERLCDALPPEHRWVPEGGGRTLILRTLGRGPDVYFTADDIGFCEACGVNVPVEKLEVTHFGSVVCHTCFDEESTREEEDYGAAQREGEEG